MIFGPAFLYFHLFMSSNELITKTRKIIVHLLPLTRNAVAYKHSFLYLHNQLYSFYKSLQMFEIRELNLIFTDYHSASI